MNLFQVKILLCLPMFILIPINLKAQTDSLKVDIQELIDELFNEPSTESDNSNLYEVLEDLINNPIDLNNATIIDIQQIPTIDYLTAKAIINFRNTVGKFVNKDNIFLIKELTNEQKKKIFPFVFVKGEKTLILNNKLIQTASYNIQLKLRSRIINDLQTREGFIDGSFPGSKPKIYNRLFAS
ncbi:MAG: hypothetical protein COW08_04420, partial [Ignavibacteriales bacterium CG12_big_fil_rev_8_21_14_0_65_30_8]